MNEEVVAVAELNCLFIVNDWKANLSSDLHPFFSWLVSRASFLSTLEQASPELECTFIASVTISPVTCFTRGNEIDVRRLISSACLSDESSISQIQKSLSDPLCPG